MKGRDSSCPLLSKVFRISSLLRTSTHSPARSFESRFIVCCARSGGCVTIIRRPVCLRHREKRTRNCGPPGEFTRSRSRPAVVHVALNPVGNPAVYPGRRDLPTGFGTSTGFAVFFAV